MRLTFVVSTAINSITTPADDFMLNFRFWPNRQLKSFIPFFVCLVSSHFNSIYSSFLGLDRNHLTRVLYFYGSAYWLRKKPSKIAFFRISFRTFLHALIVRIGIKNEKRFNLDKFSVDDLLNFVGKRIFQSFPQISLDRKLSILIKKNLSRRFRFFHAAAAKIRLQKRTSRR